MKKTKYIENENENSMMLDVLACLCLCVLFTFRVVKLGFRPNRLVSVGQKYVRAFFFFCVSTCHLTHLPRSKKFTLLHSVMRMLVSRVWTSHHPCHPGTSSKATHITYARYAAGWTEFPRILLSSLSRKARNVSTRTAFTTAHKNRTKQRPYQNPPKQRSGLTFFFAFLDLIARLSLSTLPSAHADFEAQGLAQEAFSRLERGLVGFEFVAAEDGGDDEGEFHLCVREGRLVFCLDVRGFDIERNIPLRRCVQRRSEGRRRRG